MSSLSKSAVDGDPIWMTEGLLASSAPLVLSDCDEYEVSSDGGAAPSNPEASSDTPDMEPPEYRSLNIDHPRAHRILHDRREEFDLYRVESGMAAVFSCGERFSYRQLAAAALNLDSPDPSAVELLLTQWQGPTVASITTWEDRGEFDDEEIERVGAMNLWSRATGTWRLIARTIFVTPREQ